MMLASKFNNQVCTEDLSALNNFLREVKNAKGYTGSLPDVRKTSKVCEKQSAVKDEN